MLFPERATGVIVSKLEGARVNIKIPCRLLGRAEFFFSFATRLNGVRVAEGHGAFKLQATSNHPCFCGLRYEHFN